VSQRRFYFVLTILFITGLGCNLPASILPSPTSPPDLVPLPLEDDVKSTPTVTNEPENHPTITVESPTVVEPHSTSPAGFTTTSADGSTIRFYDISGVPIGFVEISGMDPGATFFLHVAGAFTGNPQGLPVVFHSSDNFGELKQVLNGEITNIVQGPDIYSLCGAPGQDAYVYTSVTWGGDALKTNFFIRGKASSIWERVDPESWTMALLAVAGENDQLHSIFYTLEPWGIGGDIVFPPREGLYQLNLENMENKNIIPEDLNPIGLSPDNTYVAYTEVNNYVSPETHPKITLNNLVSGLMVPVELAQGSDRGGGYAVFSPDNQYVAWMEGSGRSMAETPNFHSRVRIANLDGVVLTEITDSDFSVLAADSTARWAIPVGWLDGETLLVEVRGDNWNEPNLVKVRFDGSNMELLASGVFFGFLYP